MIGYIIGLFLIGWFGFIIYVCMNISSRCSERELHETYKEAYKNYRKQEKEDDEIESDEKE